MTILEYRNENPNDFRRFRVLKSTDGKKIDRLPGGQPIIKLTARISPGDKIKDVCDEQAVKESSKLIGGIQQFFIVDDSPKIKSKGGE